MKALALEKTGKTDEAIELCAQIKALKPVDEAVLQALSLVYRSADERALGTVDDMMQELSAII